MTRLECCMCGDYGLSDELFQCKVCHFRSQHRYCSNLYPKAESYRVCNWCLTQKETSETTDQKLSTQNSSNSSKNEAESEDIKSSKKSRITRSDDFDNHHHRTRAGLKSQSQRRPADLVVQINGNAPDEKQKSPERSPVVRKRIITRGALEEKLRRTKSEDVSNNNPNFVGVNNRGNSVISKQVFRNKVRRYKLLDEVSS